ncbi:hypothetical protein Sa4125_14340 [Aureimonas sp. SA4125]|nr:hypothetical protein Sa4125_14340 [Aureimonas sp. SA4125]
MTDMLVFNEPTTKTTSAFTVPSSKEPCRCFACCHRRTGTGTGTGTATPRRAALMSWRRLAETFRSSMPR